MPRVQKEMAKVVGHHEFDQESQLPFVDVEKEPENGGSQRTLLEKVKERPLLVGIVGTLVLLALLGGILGAVLGGGSGGGEGALLVGEVADSRLVAVIREGEKCPSSEQRNASTHIILPPVALHTTNGQGVRVCNVDCTILFTNPCDTAKWRREGKKIMLSVGGEEWGSCWSKCSGKESYLSEQLANLRASLELDGVAIVLDRRTPSDVAELADMAVFYTNVTQKLRTALPVNALIGHVGRDANLVDGAWHHKVVDVVGGSIDFLVAQYFDGVTRPGLEGLDGGVYSSALQHYTTLVKGCFGGDSTKLVFGFCITSCSTDSNIGTTAAVTVMRELQLSYPCNGGASYWVGEDENGAWGNSVSVPVREIEGCSVTGVSGSSSTPLTSTPEGTSSPPVTTLAPVTLQPTAVPTSAPSTPLPAPVPVVPRPGCSVSIPLHRECLYNPNCCAAGARCYKQSDFKASCLNVCNYPPRCKLI